MYEQDIPVQAMVVSNIMKGYSSYMVKHQSDDSQIYWQVLTLASQHLLLPLLVISSSEQYHL